MSAWSCLLLLGVPFFLLGAIAGPFAPSAGQPGSTAISTNNADIVGWATAVTDYSPGPNVSNVWMNTDRALGPSIADNFDVVSLGRGSITLTFDRLVEDRPGPDFAVFENGFSLSPDLAFLELAFVEVSSDGTNFVRFPATSLTPAPSGATTNFVVLDATNLDGLAGKYTLGFGTPFDLSDLNVESTNTTFNSNAITHLRLVDIVGDGKTFDDLGNPIYDQTPTRGSVGFDLDAVAVLQAPPIDDGPGGTPFILEVVLLLGEEGFVLETSTQPGSNYVLESKSSFVNEHLNNSPLLSDGWREVFAFEATSDMRQFSIDTSLPLQFWRVRRDPPQMPDPENPFTP